MNRHYSSAEYAKLCDKLRAAFDDASITTDVMVGFNEENESDFKESLEFVKGIGFEKVHVFPYSERTGTAPRAAVIPFQSRKKSGVRR